MPIYNKSINNFVPRKIATISFQFKKASFCVWNENIHVLFSVKMATNNILLKNTKCVQRYFSSIDDESY